MQETIFNGYNFRIPDHKIELGVYTWLLATAYKQKGWSPSLSKRVRAPLSGGCGSGNRSIDLMHNDVTRLDARKECWS
jgi:hypothetical protein